MPIPSLPVLKRARSCMETSAARVRYSTSVTCHAAPRLRRSVGRSLWGGACALIHSRYRKRPISSSPSLRPVHIFFSPPTFRKKSAGLQLMPRVFIIRFGDWHVEIASDSPNLPAQTVILLVHEFYMRHDNGQGIWLILQVRL